MEPVFLLIATLVGMVTVYKSPSLKPVEPSSIKRWESSTLNSQILLSELNKDFCLHSERNFLACANSIDSMAYRLGVKFLPPGKLVSDFDREFNEKTRLQVWHDYYKEKPKVNFEKLADELIFKKTSVQGHKVLTALGINGLLSIAIDPHTYLKPHSEELELEEQSLDLDVDLENSESDDPLMNQSPTVVEVLPLQIPQVKVDTLTLSEFSRGSCLQVKKQLKKMIAEKVTLIKLDLTKNPGGYVDEASCIGSLFLGKVPIVNLVNFNKSNEWFMGKERKIYHHEMEVLVSEDSASASEILAGALQHYKRATIVGTGTYGKGTFQNPIHSKWSKYNVQLMKTSGFFYLPSGYCPQLKGLTPDTKTANSLPLEDSLFLFPKSLPENP